MDRTEGFWQDDVRTCRRCGVELGGPYCSQCGQKEVQRLTVRGTLTEVVRHLTSLDSVLLRTLVDLTRRPGRVVRRYVAGDRTGYFSPAKYAFLAATAYAFVIHFFDVDVRPTGFRDTDPRAVGAMRLVISLVSYLLFVYLLPAAAVLRRLFRRSRMTLAESYVALLYFAGQYLVASTILALAGVYSLRGGFFVARGLGFVFLLWLIADLYRASHLRTLLASVAVYAMVVLGGILSGVVAVLIYRGLFGSLG